MKVIGEHLDHEQRFALWGSLLIVRETLKDPTRVGRMEHNVHKILLDTYLNRV